MNIVQLTCEVCGKSFDRSKKDHNRNIRNGKTKIFCSVSCWGDNKKTNNQLIRKCLWCEKEFISSNNKRYKKCCSAKCSGKWSQQFVDTKKISKTMRDLYTSGYVNPNRKTKFCQICGTMYHGSRKVCSDDCLDVKLLKDRSVTSKKISNTRKKMFESGQLNVTGGTTKWIPYKNIKVQGSYEYRACFILDKMVEVGDIADWKYGEDRIPYIGLDGKYHNYLLDFKVFKKDGTYFYLETKGRVKDNDQLKWEATRKSGNELKIWFLEDIKQQEKFYGLVAPM